MYALGPLFLSKDSTSPLQAWFLNQPTSQPHFSPVPQTAQTKKNIVVDIPIPSMYGIFTYIYHENQPNVDKYAINGWYGIMYTYRFPDFFLCDKSRGSFSGVVIYKKTSSQTVILRLFCILFLASLLFWGGKNLTGIVFPLDCERS